MEQDASIVYSELNILIIKSILLFIINYMSVIGSDLASLLGESVITSKTIDLCPSHSMPKELFHFKSKSTGCQKCFITQQINFAELVDARVFCTKIMERYICVLDNATYMPCEHVQKEKEYGLPWRCAFKDELNTLVKDLRKRVMEVS